MDATPPSATTFLVVGDLHGKILPAFRLASAWARDYGRPVSALLQVGDLGYFPDPDAIDRATLRHAESDPLELGTFDVVRANDLADRVFADPHVPPGLWFTCGNHEDFEALKRLEVGSGRQPDFVVDAYGRIRCIKDGEIGTFQAEDGTGPGLSVAAVWGIDGDGPNARGRDRYHDRAFVRERSAAHLLGREFDVLLIHDSPADTKRRGYGSEHLSGLVQLAQPQFAFFGHYGGDGGPVAHDLGRTRLYHMAGLELRGRDGTPKPGSVGVLVWADGAGTFEYVPDEWLRTFTRHNWKWR